MDFLENFLKYVYLPHKAAWSRSFDSSRHPKEPLPVLGKAVKGKATLTLVRALNSYCGKMPYQSDPLNGLIDYYTHPELTQWRYLNGKWTIPFDCDDLAIYCYAALEKAGVRRDNMVIWNIIVPAPAQFNKMWANHVICATQIKYDKEDVTCVLDTNSAAQGDKTYSDNFAFNGILKDSEEAVLNKFKSLYKVDYYKLVPCEYPF